MRVLLVFCIFLAGLPSLASAENAEWHTFSPLNPLKAGSERFIEHPCFRNVPFGVFLQHVSNASRTTLLAKTRPCGVVNLEVSVPVTTAEARDIAFATLDFHAVRLLPSKEQKNQVLLSSGPGCRETSELPCADSRVFTYVDRIAWIRANGVCRIIGKAISRAGSCSDLGTEGLVSISDDGAERSRLLQILALLKAVPEGRDVRAYYGESALSAARAAEPFSADVNIHHGLGAKERPLALIVAPPDVLETLDRVVANK